MNSRLPCLLLVFVWGGLVLPALVFSQMQHSVGVDFIRLFDRVQYDGMLNLSYQLSLFEGGAVTTGIARGDDTVIIDLGCKYYVESYFDGPFLGVGIVTGRFDGKSEFGGTLSTGYETAVADHWVLSGAVEMIAGSMENPGTGHRDLIFRPVLSVVYAF